MEATFATLDCFDRVHFAQRATSPVLFSVGPTAPVRPHSTVYAAINHYAGQDRTVTMWPFTAHDGGCGCGCGSNPPTRLARPHRRGLAPEL